MRLKQYFLSPVCLSCGSWWVRETLFCKYCYEHFVEPTFEESTFDMSTHVYLMQWKKDESRAFDQLIYRLKRDQSVQALEHYADLLAAKLRTLPKLTEFSGLVPIASARLSSVHAHLLAKRISHQIGLPFLDFLEKEPGGTQQKYLTAQERKKQNPFKLKQQSYEEFTKMQAPSADRKHRFILIDDILTTGQSFLHCSDALIGSGQNMVATLFYRPPRS